MYFYKSNKIILFLLLVLFISKSYGALINGLETKDYDCFSNLRSKFNLVVAFPGTSNFNFCLSNTCAGGFVTVLTISGMDENLTAGAKIIDTDLLCFTQTTLMTIANMPVDTSVFYVKFSASSIFYNYVSGTVGAGITATIPAYYGFTIISNTIMGGTRIKLSYLNNLAVFEVLADTGVWVDADAGLVKTNLQYFKITPLNNLPDLAGYTQLYSVSLSFGPLFDVSTLPLFDNYATNQYGAINFDWGTGSPTTPFFGLNNRNVNSVTFNNAKFSKPSGIIDISTTANYNDMKFTLLDYGDLFNFNGQFPVKVNSSRTSVSVNRGEITVFPALDQYTQISIKSSKLTTALPINNGSATVIDFSNNQITGTVDESYCTTKLTINNNRMTGIIPSCFSCYMKGNVAFAMDARFANNQFSTTISGAACPSLAPIVTKYDNNSILITGKDIGFDLTNFLVDGYTCNTNSKVNRLGKEYLCYINTNFFKTLKFTTVSWPSLTNKIFTFPLVVSPPSATAVSISANGLTATLTGTFFSTYQGYANQSVEINGQPCTITSTSFTTIICTPAVITGSSQLQIIKVSTSTQSKETLINPISGAANNIPCPNDCSSNTNGICDLSTGSCQCKAGFAGLDCSGTPCSVPNCNNHGTCNTTIGQCVCDSGRTLSDCSGIQCSVPNCNNHGTCNTTNGQCGCSSGYIGLNCETPIVVCPSKNSSECSGNGVCNGLTGVCTCDADSQGTDCSTPFNQCPTKTIQDCSGFGQCNNVTGICTCSPNAALNDCSGFQCVIPDCNGHGSCNYVIGECKCNQMWSGDTCLTPLHYITSIEPSTIDGGEVIFTGSFGDDHSNLTITIGGLDCPVTFNSSIEIRCTAAPGQGIKIVNITQNDLTYISKDQYIYIDTNPIIPCPSDCFSSLSQGTCNTQNGQCICNTGYGSFDCSTLPPNKGDSGTTNGEGSSEGTLPPTKTTVNETKGSTSITNQDTSFEIYIRSLIEVSFNGDVIHSYPLQQNWKLNSSVTDNLNTFMFDQTIQGSNCKISSKIEEIKDPNGKKYSFAGVDFNVDSGNVKFSISISNYTYENNLNTLNLEIVSSSSQLDIEDQDDNSCNEKDSELDTVNYNDKSNLNYIKISKNNKVLSGRFINKVISDGKPTFLGSTVSKVEDGSSIVTTFNLPHFVKQASIDPDFSVLLSTDFKSSCGSDNKRKAYVIPVAVVASVVGVAAIIGGVVLYRKKKDESLLLKSLLNKIKK